MMMMMIIINLSIILCYFFSISLSIVQLRILLGNLFKDPLNIQNLHRTWLFYPTIHHPKLNVAFVANCLCQWKFQTY
ncbi:hypothetical protein BZA70DRAFT_284595 [Myxozyma melibiosi]|uniref:Secreted protein n=1 Tax=Myxozyma melibiosi TaxID=54550 RepID=A0ABR1EZJ3_9ASCO